MNKATKTWGQLALEELHRARAAESDEIRAIDHGSREAEIRYRRNNPNT